VGTEIESVVPANPSWPKPRVRGYGQSGLSEGRRGEGCGGRAGETNGQTALARPALSRDLRCLGQVYSTRPAAITPALPPANPTESRGHNQLPPAPRHATIVVITITFRSRIGVGRTWDVGGQPGSTSNQ
jgi:hypothetical protein